MKDELLALEACKAALERDLAQAPAAAPALHPRIAELYRRKVENLVAELNRPELWPAASEALRSLIDEVRLVPENGRLEIENVGALAGLLAVAGAGADARPAALISLTIVVVQFVVSEL